jgi:p-aminobenzoyl-glutamate transporter AbgT
MEQRNDSMRERLLARLPQPENIAAYREETTTLLAKHARALRWDKFTANALAFLALAMVFLWNHGPWRLGTTALIWLQVMSGVFFFLGVIYSVRHEVYASQVATLKEIKQVQLQLLEVQARLDKTNLPNT